MENNISLRERIRLNLVAAMEAANITQVQLADKLNISKGTVNNWIRGNNSPDVDTVPKICEVLGVSVLSLYSPCRLEQPEPVTEIRKAPDTEESAPGAVSVSKVEAMLIELGFIRPGEDLSDADLRFIIATGEMIRAWFKSKA